MPMILRLLGPQGIAGLALSLALGLLLMIQKVETRHWKKQSGQFERLYAHEQAAFAGTVADYRAAADKARAADRANLQRVAAQQRSISERTANDYEARIAAVRQSAQRLSAQRLRGHGGAGATGPRAGGAAAMPGLRASAAGAAEAPGEDRFPVADRQLATEQAIQLDELIKWVRAQAAVEPVSETQH